MKNTTIDCNAAADISMEAENRSWIRKWKIVSILYIVTDTLQTSYKVDDIDTVFYLHNFIQHCFIYTIIVLFHTIVKCDPIHTIHSNIILAHVFFS